MDRTKEYNREEEEHKAKIPELTTMWIEKGHEYHGTELGECLDIVNELNNGCTFETAKDILDSQKHSGTGWVIVVSMVKSFCKRGEEFANYVNMSKE